MRHGGRFLFLACRLSFAQVAQCPSSIASRPRKNKRARCNLVFTADTVSPSAAAGINPSTLRPRMEKPGIKNRVRLGSNRSRRFNRPLVLP